MDSLPTRAVVLLSGGLDSSTVLAEARAAGYACYALTIRYGQRHDPEITAAGRVAEALGVVDHAIIDLDLRRFGGSALTADIPVPKDRDPSAAESDIPSTYVPARNTIFLALALAWAEVLGTPHIFIGINAVDYSGYPDCRPEYVEAFQRMAGLATKAGVEGTPSTVHTPLAEATKSEIIQRGVALGLDYGMTVSCYDPAPDGAACGGCDACRIRRRGFEEAGVADPTHYARAVR